jgi:PAB-dependent poly(A)-specific ribonuclease subunit 2
VQEVYTHYFTLDVCLACELGFLLTNIERANGTNCHATNFLRSFSNIPQTTALGLLEKSLSSNQQPYGHLIQSMNRFLCEQFHQECIFHGLDHSIENESTENKVKSRIQEDYGIWFHQFNVCACNSSSEKITSTYCLDLLNLQNVLKLIFIVGKFVGRMFI